MNGGRCGRIYSYFSRVSAVMSWKFCDINVLMSLYINRRVQLYKDMILVVWYKNLTQGKVGEYQLSANSIHCSFVETERARET
jgi:hypothetical protein